MCGRYVYRVNPAELALMLGGAGTAQLSVFEPRYNIAPSSLIPAVQWDDRDFLVTSMTWGLKPDWAKSLLINAQAEKYVAPKQSYWAGFERCLIPASGFYEWRRTPGSVKQPMYIRRADGLPMLFAGLCQEIGTSGSLYHCVILTTTPNDLMRPIHHRMPLILRDETYEVWADPKTERTSLSHVLTPYPAEEMVAHPVSRRVNSATVDDPELIEPIHLP